MRPSDPIALFKRSVSLWPQREALRVDGTSFTYAELDHWSDAIANRLSEEGAGKQRVAFIAHRQAASYAGILGILKANGALVPLPPDGPTARWRAMLDGCGARVMLGDRSPFTDLKAIAAPEVGTAASFPTTEAPPGTEAYVLFTSGSTGGPKGVSVSRDNLAAYLGHMTPAFEFNERDRFTQHFALTFDLAMHDLFVCWGVGACLCVPPEHGALRAASYVRDEAITVWFSVPSLPTMMTRMRTLNANAMPTVRLAFFCGETLTFETARAFAHAAPNARLVNLYGPTETTIAITAHEVEPDLLASTGDVPIGKLFPAHNARIVEGELMLCGPQVANGYVNAPEAQAHAFTSMPGATERWYRTGDRAAMDADGTLHHLGRVDDQVKVLGHRTEPGEVDALLAPLLNGGRSITVPIKDQGGTRLATFIDVPFDQKRIHGHCAEHLPNHMVPVRFIRLDEWPLTAHGKTDKLRLVAIAEHGQ